MLLVRELKNTIDMKIIDIQNLPHKYENIYSCTCLDHVEINTPLDGWEFCLIGVRKQRKVLKFNGRFEGTLPEDWKEIVRKKTGVDSCNGAFTLQYQDTIDATLLSLILF